MVQLQDDATRRDAGPILGALSALGLMVAFVALQRSKPRQGHEDEDKRRAFATYLRDHLAGADTAIQIVQRLSDACRGADEGPFSSRCPNSFVKTAASSRESWPISDTPRGQPSDWPVGRPGVPFA